MRIYINGRGSISAAGNTAAESYEAFRSRQPTWSVHPATGLPVYSIPQLPLHTGIAAFARKRGADRATVLSLHAAEQAVKQANWEGENFAILVGCSRGPTGNWEAQYDYFRQRGAAMTKASPRTTLGGIGFALADYFNTASVATGMSVTCSSGFHALLHGVALLRSGMVDKVLVGGAEAPITTFTLRQMQAMRIYAAIPEAPHQHACRPLMHGTYPSSGMALGEGAAFVCLSKQPADYTVAGLGFARERTKSATGISPEGAGLYAAMKAALTEADVAYADAIVHDPGTERGGKAEQHALGRLFGHPEINEADAMSNKHLTGHTFGASGPLGLDFALSLLEANYRPEHPVLLVNATGFGGNAVSVVVRKKVS